MRNKRLQSQVTAGRWTLPAVIFICALCWVLTYFLFPGSIASTVLEDSPSAWQPARNFLLPGWADRIVSFLIYATIGYFLIELNNQFSIIRAGLPCRQLFISCWSPSVRGMHLLYIGDIVASVSYFHLFSV